MLNIKSGADHFKSGALPHFPPPGYATVCAPLRWVKCLSAPEISVEFSLDSTYKNTVYLFRLSIIKFIFWKKQWKWFLYKYCVQTFFCKGQMLIVKWNLKFMLWNIYCFVKSKVVQGKWTAFFVRKSSEFLRKKFSGTCSCMGLTLDIQYRK